MRFERFIDESAVILVVDQKVEVEADVFAAAARIGVADFVFAFHDDFADGVFQFFPLFADDLVAPVAGVFKDEFLLNVVDIYHFCLLFSIRVVRRR